MSTSERARGKWRGILIQLGTDKKFLENKHGPCPFCNGTDRYRFDNREGKGTFICSQCGAGDGFEFLKRLKGWDFKTAAAEIDAALGYVREKDQTKPMASDKQRLDNCHKLWANSIALTGEDPASCYLAGRGVLPNRLPTFLAYHAACPVPNAGGYLPAMLALVHRADGKLATIHRTFLGPNGKADIDTPRALMPGELTDGCAVRIYPVHGERLGIAEGIETAIAAAKRFNVPVWAAINSTMLKAWTPPAGVKEVVIFGDNDPAFGGQAAAYALAHRLAVKEKLAVDVRIPGKVGKDWADSDAA